MSTPHVHSQLIKAWADGAIIEAKSPESGCWVIIGNPLWLPEQEYRVKPEPKPDIVRYIAAYRKHGVTYVGDCVISAGARHNIRLIFDGETEQLKAVELIK